MKRGGEFLQGYNCHTAVDEERQVILACMVTNQAPDCEHLPPVIVQVESNCGESPGVLLGDAGYWDKKNAAFCEEHGIDAYLATGRLKRGEKPPPVRGRPPASLDAKGKMHRKLRTKKGQRLYAKRKAIVEPRFGQIKEARGFRRFLLRGLPKVRAEWALVCATHNLRKLYRTQAEMA